MAINLSTLVNQTNPLQLCKAWVNFNGTGTIGQSQTIRSNYNVSSVTKNGTGDYTVNFTTPMADANYSWAFGVQGNVGSSFNQHTNCALYSLSTASIRLNSGDTATNTLADSPYISVQIFGN
jgi:hypothetical protein